MIFTVYPPCHHATLHSCSTMRVETTLSESIYTDANGLENFSADLRSCCLFAVLPLRASTRSVAQDVIAWRCSASHALFIRENLRLPVRSLRQNILPKVQLVSSPARKTWQPLSLTTEQSRQWQFMTFSVRLPTATHRNVCDVL